MAASDSHPCIDDFWTENQPGFRFSAAEVGSPEFFAEIEKHRYSLEPHIPEVAGFERWADRDVLEAGCGIGTDGLQFARAGARYTGLDSNVHALRLASNRFEMDGQRGRFVEGSVSDLPFDDVAFDMVFSHGVIHHIRDTEAAVQEFHRVLRPGGTALAMVYHRNSLNYRFSIMLFRRALAGLLLIPGASKGIARVTGESPSVLLGHRRLLAEHGHSYLTNKELFLASNTDGPGNPLSKVYSRREALDLFRSFRSVAMQTRFLNLRIYPHGHRLAGTRVARRLERRFGWHLYLTGQK